VGDVKGDGYRAALTRAVAAGSSGGGGAEGGADECDDELDLVGVEALPLVGCQLAEWVLGGMREDDVEQGLADGGVGGRVRRDAADCGFDVVDKGQEGVVDGGGADPVAAEQRGVELTEEVRLALL